MLEPRLRARPALRTPRRSRKMDRMSSDSTRPSLLARVQDAQDHDAWREFDATYRDLVLGYCRSRGLQPADAEDVRQLVMMSLSRVLKDWQYRRDRGRFRAYLGCVVRNAVARHLGHTSKGDVRLETEIRAVLAAPDAPPLDERWEREWVKHHYRRAMATVRETFSERSVRIFERLLEGAPAPRVAAEFETTDQAVHQIKQRIKTRMSALIAEQVAEEEGHGRPDE